MQENIASQTPKREFVYTGYGKIPQDITHVKFSPGVIGFDGTMAFLDCCDSLKEVVLNEAIKTIERRAISECSSLESIHILSTVISISMNSFHGCSTLNMVVLNEGLQAIGGSVFWLLIIGKHHDTLYRYQYRHIIILLLQQFEKKNHESLYGRQYQH